MALFRKDDEISALIKQGVEITGQLNFEGQVRLDGKFTGEIRSNGTLVIGESAIVEAEIFVDTVVVCGRLNGNIQARTRVQLHAPAKVYGNISTVHLMIDDWVLFEGQSQRLKDDEPLPALTENPAV